LPNARILVVALGALCMPAAARPDDVDAMKAGAAAERAGEVAQAEAAYRQAWLDPAQRSDAANALRALYDRGGASPEVDADALAQARKDLGPDFLLTETRHFVILSDADQAWTRQRSAMLERARHQYFRVMDRLEAPVYPHPHKLLCILFKRHERYRAFARAEEGAGAEWVAGYYSPGANRIAFYDDSTSPDFQAAATDLREATDKVKDLRAQSVRAGRDGQAQYADALEASAADLEQRIKGERGRISGQARATSTAKTLHEAIHLLAFNTGLQHRSQRYPFWLSEGLASCFETDQPDAGAFGPDHASRLRRTPTESTIPLAELIVLVEVPDSSSDEPADLAQQLYTRSQALFAYLYRHKRDELRSYFLALLAEPAERGPERDRALFEEAFGRPESLERRLRAN
jgi:hypothetical protein